MHTSPFTAKKEAKRLEKEAKYAAKAAKVTAAPANEKKAKVEKVKEKEKVEEEAPFVNTTPKGEKKGTPMPLPGRR